MLNLDTLAHRNHTSTSLDEIYSSIGGRTGIFVSFSSSNCLWELSQILLKWLIFGWLMWAASCEESLWPNISETRYFWDLIFLWPNISVTWYFWDPIFLRPNISVTPYFCDPIFLRSDISQTRYFSDPIFLRPDISRTRYFSDPIFLWPDISEIWYFSDLLFKCK